MGNQSRQNGALIFSRFWQCDLFFIACFLSFITREKSPPKMLRSPVFVTVEMGKLPDSPRYWQMVEAVSSLAQSATFPRSHICSVAEQEI